MVIVVTLFVPISWWTYIKTMSGSAMQGMFAVFAIAFRPFADKFEDVMDIGSQVTNTVNLVVALGLSMGFMSDAVATIALFVSNCSAIFVFLVNICAYPIRYIWAQREAVCYFFVYQF